MNIAQKSTFVLNQRDLLGIEGLSREEILGLLDLAEHFVELNAPGGIPDYCWRYGASLSALSAANPVIYEGENLGRILAQWGKALTPDQVAARMCWRDRRLAALRLHNRSQPAD